MNNTKNNALIAAMQSLCLAFPFKSESWIAEHANKQVDEILKYIDSDEKYYIRIGENPCDGYSSIYKMGIKVGKEVGVSVYKAIKIDDKWHIVIPTPLKTNQGNTLEYLIKQVCRSTDSRKIYLVTGEEVGVGSDNEPLLKNIEIVEDLTSSFVRED